MLRRCLMSVCLVLAAVAVGSAFLSIASASARPAERDTINSAQSSRQILDLRVAFRVQNSNTSRVACASDGAAYTIRGHLVGARGAIQAREPVVSLYLHSLDSGEWDWRAPIPGYDYGAEMARLGHVSLAIDRIGYDASGHPYGYQSCIGSQADVAHQIVQQLRSGSYSVEGAAAAPRFSSVVLAGHSLGGLIAEVKAYSYKDVDGLIVMSWTDLGSTPQNQAKFERVGPRCLLQAEDAEPGGPGGYIFYDLNEAEFRAMFQNAEPRVVDTVAALRNRTPCGDLGSILTAIGVNGKGLGEISVPVLLVYGRDDRAFQGFEDHRNSFTGSDDVTLHVFENTGHYVTLERSAPVSRAAIARWLSRSNKGGPIAGKSPTIHIRGVPSRSCASRSFRVRVGIEERSAPLKVATLSLDRRTLTRTSRTRFSRLVRAAGLPSGRHRLTVSAVDLGGRRAQASRYFGRCEHRGDHDAD